MNRYLKNNQGQGMSEYLILVLLISVGSIAATESLGGTVSKKIKEIQRKIEHTNFGGSRRGSESDAGSGDAGNVIKEGSDVLNTLENVFGNKN